jgi:hypothetical protein
MLQTAQIIPPRKETEDWSKFQRYSRMMSGSGS